MGESDHSAAELRLRLLPDEATPLYLQIVHQLKQLILTHRLDDGARLPAVRTLAETLGINPGTVVQAYRELANEGLVESVRGRGTVVRRLSTLTADELARAALLEQAAAAMATRSRALGFSADDARQQLAAALLAAQTPVPVVFVGMQHSQAERYVAEQLNPRYEAAGIEFVPFGVDAVVKGLPALVNALQVAYTVVTFVTTAPEVERHLEAMDIDVELLGVTAELAESSVERLRSLDPGAQHTIVTEQRSTTNAVALVASESGIDPSALAVIASEPDGSIDELALQAAVDAGSTLIYSFGVRHWIAALDVPGERVIDLEFRLTDDAIARLDARWGLV